MCKTGPRRNGRPRARGFSLIELLIVCAIALVLMAIAVPSVVNTVGNFQMRGSMGELSALFQNCRTTAVKTNKVKWLRFQQSGGRWVAYVDDAANSTSLTSSSAQMFLPAGFSKSAEPSGTGNPTALDASTLWGSSVDTSTTASTPSSDLDTYFNSLGIPCTYSNGNCTNQSFVYYFTRTDSSGNTKWSAIAVSPAGRIKSRYWSGSAWGE
jgi:prepilin-type N-terminal cleavage/methylation domain-containing protein